VGHTLIVGATGAGKSVLVNTMLAQWRRYPDAQVFLFDVGGSGYLLAEAVGGTHYNLAGDQAGGLRLQPLACIDRDSERMWASSWLETLLDLTGVTVTPEQRTELGRALRILAQDPVAMRTLSNLRIQVQDAEIRDALREFCRGGTYGHLLDGATDSIAGATESTYQVFELSRIRELHPSVFIPILLYLFRVVERRLRADRPTLIVLEEVWSALMESQFAVRIKQWLLTLRKRNAAVVLVAHTPAQIAELDNREVIIDSCPTKIYLPNPEAAEPESARLYTSMGLTDREVQIIARATKKKHYFF
jgi:type IV secretion system protein VirB4